MKRVSFNSLQSSPEEARIRQRHQRLLQDYLELQKGSMEEKETNKEAIRLQKKPKNCLINGKRVGKKKISVQDQVVLEV
ncbi:hypothetical protein L484_013193 [Morus notabilis]|uniref:Uncharacterized protein n=1 Tax=Morus notabilis TaxID=981085 RepID=W9RPW1_9ROSA|nr:hypothetical protein L484_013193 [Morus notabilis]